MNIKTPFFLVRGKEILSRLHFSPTPVFTLGNWIPRVLYSWGCGGHNCGLAQVLFSSPGECGCLDGITWLGCTMLLYWRRHFLNILFITDTFWNCRLEHTADRQASECPI